MEVKEFAKQLKRMCNCYDVCDKKCELYNPFCVGHIIRIFSDEEIESAVNIVEEWSKENSVKTRQSVFLEQYPETELGIDGVIEICPSRVSATYRRDTGPCTDSNCIDCRREFWMQEVE